MTIRRPLAVVAAWLAAAWLAAACLAGCDNGEPLPDWPAATTASRCRTGRA
jgi:hypothetical protein